MRGVAVGADVERRCVVADGDLYVAAVFCQFAEEHLFGERLFDVFLDEPRHRPRAHFRVVAVLAEPGFGDVIEADADVFVFELLFEFDDVFVDDVADGVRTERGEADDGIQAVSEFGGEVAFDGRIRLRVAGFFGIGRGEADAVFFHFKGANVAGEDDDEVAAVDFAAVAVGDLAVVHDLQQQVHDVRVRFFDFVQQQHGVRVFLDLFGEQSALFVADVAGRRADEAADGV